MSSSGALFVSVVHGHFNQADSRELPGNTNASCLANASCALAFRATGGSFSRDSMDEILRIGLRVYWQVKPREEIYLEPEDLPDFIEINSQIVDISSIVALAGGYFPRDEADVVRREIELTEKLIERFNADPVGSGYLFTGQSRTVSFWSDNGEFYLFDSHGVGDNGKRDMNFDSNNTSRLFRCNCIAGLAKLLLLNSYFGGNESQYNIHRLLFRVRTAPEDIINSASLSQPSSYSTSSLNVSSFSISTEESTVLPVKKTRGRPSKRKAGRPKSNTSLQDRSKDYSKRYRETHPGQRSQSNKNYKDSHHDVQEKAVEKYKTANPEVRKKAVEKYKTANPEVQKGAVEKYKTANPEVQKKAVEKYKTANPEVQKKAVEKYKTANPKVQKKAVEKYKTANPEVQKKAVEKYKTANPEVQKKAVEKYKTANPEVQENAKEKYQTIHPESQRELAKTYRETHPDRERETNARNNSVKNTARHLPNDMRRGKLVGEYNNKELLQVGQFAFKNKSLRGNNSCRCQYCGSHLFYEELGRIKWCCQENSSNVTHFAPLNEPFYSSGAFLQHPRFYNDLFAFCAMTTRWAHLKSGLSFVKIQGRTYHKVHDLSMANTYYANQSFMYIDDGEARKLLAEHHQLDTTIVQQIQRFLETNNPFIAQFKRLALEPCDTAHLIFECTTRRTHGPVLGERPQTTEVAAVISNETEVYDPRKICIWKVGEAKSHTIDSFHPLMEPFQYPLLYPRGEEGWFINKTNRQGGKLTQLKYVRCLLLSEPRFTAFGRLSETWLVDMYARIEEERLRYIAMMQKRHHNAAVLRNAQLDELQNAVQRQPLVDIANDETVQGEGIVAGRIYLPYTFTGGPRYMKLRYLDAMAIVERLGRPHYFLTFTANGQWAEMKSSVYPTSKSGEPQIASRVFKIYFDELIRDLKSGRFFGKLVYIVWVIEFQMRGLPHTHICFRVENGPVQANDVDRFIRADIPDPTEANGKLRELVLRHMIHGPFCSRPRYGKHPPCYDETLQKCTKFYPKNASDVTFIDSRGFYNYKRNANNKAVVKFGLDQVEIDDTWVVPYNAALLMKYNCHCNLEIASARKVIHYLFKYITKGVQLRNVAVVPENGPASKEKNDEVENYVTKRYIGSCDAAWRILEFELTGRKPTVTMLPIHLEGAQNVCYRPGNENEAIDQATSKLIIYFNRPNCAELENLTYIDFYENYIVHPTRPRTKTVAVLTHPDGKHFITKRQRGETVGRIFFVSPIRGELYYLRVLLSKHPGRSFDDFIKLGGDTCSSFQEAAKALGLVNNEDEFRETLTEAAAFMYGRRLRSFFVLLCNVGAPAGLLWSELKDVICLDLIERFPDDIERAYKEGLVQIDRNLRNHGSSLKDQGLPIVEDDTTELGRELINYSATLQRAFLDEWESLLSNDQRHVYEYVQKLLNQDQYVHDCPRTIFVDAPGGYGKSKLLEIIAAYARANSKITLCVASSGIAALNLPGGVTAHSLFKLPITLVDPTAYWGVSAGSQRGELIRRASLIIYDECSMSHRYLIEMIDRSLKDLMQSSHPFGGKIVIFSGDFRQIAPVVEKARTAIDVISVSLKSSHLWRMMKVFKLVTPQRITNHPEFSSFLLEVGNGTATTKTFGEGRNTRKLIELSHVVTVQTVAELINFVFPADLLQNPDACANRAILSTHNVNVNDINDQILKVLSGDMITLYSVDYLDEDQEKLDISEEMLHQAQGKGVPNHTLNLKVNALCIITRNLHFGDRLVNGTKVIIISITPRLIVVRKPHESQHEQFGIPRIIFKFNIGNNSPVQMCRRQFPLQLCYSLSIHKSQGQTLDTVGLDLRNPCFAHGQLYVALSRARSPEEMRILVADGDIKNGMANAKNFVYRDLIN